MAKKSSVKLDFKDLEKMQKKLAKKCSQAEQDAFWESCVKELAARLIAKVVKRTPVGDYPQSTGKMGGTLRRGWTSGGKSNASGYVQSLPIQHVGHDYIVTITNPVEYASYVEYGHRTRNHQGWVDGKFMLTISENEIRKSSPKILANKLDKYLKGLI